MSPGRPNDDLKSTLASVSFGCQWTARPTWKVNVNKTGIYKEESRPRTALELQVVEAAGIEPASASPTSQDLHAYSAFNLALGYPAEKEDLKPVR